MTEANTMVRESNKRTYGSLKEGDKISEKHKRELGRIRSSPTFRLGALFTKSVEKPWRLLWLPFSIFLLLVQVVRERVGATPRYSNSEPFTGESGQRNCVVFFPTNGVGLGHFTRLLSIARRMKKADPDMEAVFFTTSPTLHILQQEGFAAYRLPGRKEFSNMEASTWNSITEEMLSNVFAIHRPKAFLFDGSYPYRGMLNAIVRRDDILRIWVRRGSFKKNAPNVPMDSLDIFDYLIRPGDSVEPTTDEDEANNPTIHCDPVVLLDDEDIVASDVLKSRLGIPDDEIVAYVQLGAGNINDISSDISIILGVLHDAGVWAVNGESILGSRIEVSELPNVRLLRYYPNSRYFSSFDFGVISGGYNSFHEAIMFSLPCICIPNTKTGMDDQIARAKIAEDAGFMLVEENVTRPRIKNLVSKIADPENRQSMVESGNSLRKPNGASQVADHISRLIFRD